MYVQLLWVDMFCNSCLLMLFVIFIQQMVIYWFFSNFVLLDIEFCLLVIKMMILVVLVCVLWLDVNENCCVQFSVFLIDVNFEEYVMDKIVDWILFKVEYLFKLKIFVEDELNFIILNWFVVGLIKKCVIKL